MTSEFCGTISKNWFCIQFQVLVSFAFLAVANGGLLHEGLQVAQEPAPLPALPAEPLAFQQFAAPLPAQPIGIPGWEQPPVPLQSESIVGIEKNILKTVHVRIFRTKSKFSTNLKK